MDAHGLRAAILAAVALSIGAGYRTQNFVVSAPSPELAREIGDAAEVFRRQLAVEWLGNELPPWSQPCPITAQVAPHLGAGGATSFIFGGGKPYGWRMSIQGSRERLLDSVLPHEVTHTIFATHFGQPLPRWADEGACTTVEHPSERAKQDEFLLQFMRSNPPRSIPFNKMFRMTEYPHDIMPLYSQGHSVARYLIAQGGKRKFVDFVGRGMSAHEWDAAVLEFYGFQDLSDLQLRWVAWVAQGSPSLSEATLLADAQAGARQAPPTVSLAATSGAGRWEPVPPRTAAPVSSRADGEVASGAGSDSVPESVVAAGSWYARQKTRAEVARRDQLTPTPLAFQDRADAHGVEPESHSGLRGMSRPQPPQQAEQRILDWGDGPSRLVR